MSHLSPSSGTAMLALRAPACSTLLTTRVQLRGRRLRAQGSLPTGAAYSRRCRLCCVELAVGM
eukprot:15469267-Alexandrium_andersonii.AAC.1